jgi:hypothetical protein
MRLSLAVAPVRVLKSRQALAFAMLAGVFEALCVLGRAGRPVVLRGPEVESTFVAGERPKGRAQQDQLELTPLGVASCFPCQKARPTLIPARLVRERKQAG